MAFLQKEYGKINKEKKRLRNRMKGWWKKTANLVKWQRTWIKNGQ